MDFKDWRRSPDETQSDEETPKVNSYRGKWYQHYIDEQIREAQARGEFDNLQGFGKPLNLDNNPYAGDKAMGYNLLKSNGFAPAAIELAKEISTEFARAETKLAKVRHQGRTLRARRIPPFASEKRAYNLAVEKAAAAYEQTLHDLNRKILTLNLSAPSALHKPMFEVEKLVQEFRKSCPLLA